MNEFSLPMPFKKEHIDFLCEINQQIEKSKITNLFFALFRDCVDATGFEQARNGFGVKTKFEDWAGIIEYTLEKGFDFIYLLNLPLSIEICKEHLDINLEKLDNLIEKLKKIGCNKFRVTHVQLLAYLIEKYPDIDVYMSTSAEYKTIKEYVNFIKLFPQIKQIVPSHDVNKNFRLLKNIRKQFPNLNIEIMVNEGCIGGCPLRSAHANSMNSIMIEEAEDKVLSHYFYTINCAKLKSPELIKQTYLSTNIYPWEIEEYNKIGINNFKLVGRNSKSFINGEYFIYYLQYLKGVDDIKNIENIKIRNFSNYNLLLPIDYKVKEIKPYLPNIKHFVKHGHLCASECGFECRYCFNLVEKLEKKYKRKS